MLRMREMAPSKGGGAVSRPYLCPVCRANRVEFELVYKLAQEIRKDPDTGRTVYRADELAVLTKEDGRPDLDVKCRQCGYVGAESTFSRAASRKDARGYNSRSMIDHSPRESRVTPAALKPRRV